MKTNINYLIFLMMLTLTGQNIFGQIKGSGECIYVNASAMNILYIGLDNPVLIANNFKADSISVSGCGIMHVTGNEYLAKPTTAGIDKIFVNVHDNKKVEVYDFEFRVRRIPDPYVYVGNSKSGQLKLDMFRAFKNIVIKNPDFPFQLTYELNSFEMTWISTDGKILKDKSESKDFTVKMIEFQSSAKPGDFIIINAIIKMPDRRTVPIVGTYHLIDG